MSSFGIFQIIGEPSKSLMEEMGKTEADRVAKQREELGKDGLQKKADILEKATEENEVWVISTCQGLCMTFNLH